MEFLHANTKSLLDSEHDDGRYISAKDKDVIRDRRRRYWDGLCRHVAAATAAEPHPVRDPVEAAAGPRRGQSVAAVAQGVQARLRSGRAAALFGNDPREYLISTKRFVGDAAGRLNELHTVRVEWVRDNGRVTPREIPGSERVFPAQLVLLAMGFLGPENQLLDQLGVEKDARTNARPSTGSLQRVFRACSRPATCAGDRVSLCGRSTKAAARPASAIAF